MDEKHYCITCEKNLDIDNFYFNKTKNKLYNKCKLCIKQNKKLNPSSSKISNKPTFGSSIILLLLNQYRIVIEL